MKRENSVLKYIVILAAALPVFLAVNLVAGCIIVTTTPEVYAVIVLGISDFFFFIFFPYIISRYLQSRDEAARTEWIAGVSHDIRTPLSLVLGNADKLLQEEGAAMDEETVRKNARIIREQALRIKELVTNLNTENRISYPGIRRRADVIVLDTLVRDVFAGLLNSTDSDKYEGECLIDPSAGGRTVTADEELLRRMLENLIGNSIRHNPDGCMISVSLAATDRRRQSKLIISDNGTGADPATLNMLNSSPFSISSPGHGMGLRVVKKIARLYRWQIRFSSVQGGGFSTCIVIRNTGFAHRCRLRPFMCRLCRRY